MFLRSVLKSGNDYCWLQRLKGLFKAVHFELVKVVSSCGQLKAKDSNETYEPLMVSHITERPDSATYTPAQICVTYTMSRHII